MNCNTYEFLVAFESLCLLSISCSYIKLDLKVELPAVPFLVEMETSKGKGVGQATLAGGW